MRYVAPDTNIFLHFEPIFEWTAAELGLSENFTWLVPFKVISELDAQKGNAPKPLRGRAAASNTSIEQLLISKKSLASGFPLLTHKRCEPINFMTHGLLENEADDWIIADLIDFQALHLDAQILVLSNDLTMRMRAASHGLTAVKPPEHKRRPDIDDERDREIRDLRARITDISQTMPDLELRFDGEDERGHVHFELLKYDDADLDGLAARASRPAPEEEYSGIMGQEGGMTQLLRAFQQRLSVANESYDGELLTYAAAFREYLRASWTADHRTVAISPVIHSRNGVQAEAVGIRLISSVKVNMLDAPPQADRPVKPLRFLAPGASHKFSHHDYSDWLSGYVPRFDSLAVAISDTEDGCEARYGAMRILQKDRVRLNPFYIVFENEASPPVGLVLTCEMRAKNLNGMVARKLVVKISEIGGEFSAKYLLDAG